VVGLSAPAMVWAGGGGSRAGGWRGGLGPAPHAAHRLCQHRPSAGSRAGCVLGRLGAGINVGTHRQAPSLSRYLQTRARRNFAVQKFHERTWGGGRRQPEVSGERSGFVDKPQPEVAGERSGTADKPQ